jgi:hypothetical protein
MERCNGSCGGAYDFVPRRSLLIIISAHHEPLGETEMSYSENERRRILKERGLDNETIETIIKQDKEMEKHFNELECLMCGGVVVREKNENPSSSIPFALDPGHAWFRYECQDCKHCINRQEIEAVH